jgi:hypothetical protein
MGDQETLLTFPTPMIDFRAGRWSGEQEERRSEGVHARELKKLLTFWTPVISFARQSLILGTGGQESGGLMQEG